MGNYFAKELREEYIDVEMYFDEDSFFYNKIWLGGNRDFVTKNAELFDNVCKKAEYAIEEYNTNIENDLPTSKVEVAKTYFQPIDREVFSEEELIKLMDFSEYLYYDTKAPLFVTEMLSIIYGKKFKLVTLRGCCQGEWIDAIYSPELVSDRLLNFIEALYFGTGVEYLVSDTKLDSLDELDFDNGSTYFCPYVPNIKEYLAEEIGCAPKELKIASITKEHYVTTYDYKIE